MILRSFPDVWPHTSANASYRAAFYARWGRESAVVRARATQAEFPPYPQTLSIKAAWGGDQSYFVGSRRLAVDDDSYLVLNEGQTYGSELRAARTVDSLGIFFRPRMAEAVCGELAAGAKGVLDHGAAPPHRPFAFSEHLRRHDEVVSPSLRNLMASIDAGEDDEVWLDEQLTQLLARLLVSERNFRGRGNAIDALRPATRDELVCRVARAADFLLSSYAEAVTLDDVAAAAHLSKYHLVRLFRRVYGITPHGFLQRKRASVARRMIESSDDDLGDIAVAVGFGTRFTMFRQLRHHYGSSGLALRRAAQR
jgi:AraC-like DNA-binding protein